MDIIWTNHEEPWGAMPDGEQEYGKTMENIR
jgi:hypothetical protein